MVGIFCYAYYSIGLFVDCVGSHISVRAVQQSQSACGSHPQVVSAVFFYRYAVVAWLSVSVFNLVSGILLAVVAYGPVVGGQPDVAQMVFRHFTDGFFIGGADGFEMVFIAAADGCYSHQ